MPPATASTMNVVSCVEHHHDDHHHHHHRPPMDSTDSFVAAFDQTVGYSMELLACDENARNRVMQEANGLFLAATDTTGDGSSLLLGGGGGSRSMSGGMMGGTTRGRPSRTDLLSRDYAKIHDDFLSSLLQEQTQTPSYHPPLDPKGSEDSSLLSFPPPSTNTAQQQPPPPPSSIGPMSDTTNVPAGRLSPDAYSLKSSSGSIQSEPAFSNKRRRPKLLRMNSRRRRSNQQQQQQRQVVDLSAMERPDFFSEENGGGGGGGGDVNTVGGNSIGNSTNQDSLHSKLDGLLSDSNLLPPSMYMHEHCKLQKDKGKGEKPGHDICAWNRDECLVKLRAKMELLTQVAVGDGDQQTIPLSPQAKSAQMRRKKAKVSEHTDSYIETRSLLKLKMGFLSMQYGVLIRWDIQETGLIHLVVLRKMCEDSFYRAFVVRSSSMMSFAAASSTATPSDLELKGVVVDDAILQRGGANCEVALLSPPYLVPRPIQFEPSTLAISNCYLTGLRPDQQWCIVASIVNGPSTAREGTYKSILQQLDASNQWHCKSSTADWRWQIPSGRDVLLTLKIMEVAKFGPRTRKRQWRQLDITIPKTGDASKWYALPVEDSEGVIVQVQIAHASPYTQWVVREVEERKRLEQQDLSSVDSSSQQSDPLPGGSGCHSYYYYGSNNNNNNTTQDHQDDDDDDPDLLWDLCCVW